METEVAQHEEAASLLHNPELWVAVAFFIFAAVFLKFVWPVIMKMLDGRSAKIKHQLDQASRLRAEAEALLLAYQQEREEKTREAEAIVTAAKNDADALRARAEVELQQNLDRRSQQAIEKIARAEADATAFIRTQMIELASAAASDVIRTELEKSGKEDPSIANAIRAIEQQIH